MHLWEFNSFYRNNGFIEVIRIKSKYFSVFLPVVVWTHIEGQKAKGIQRKLCLRLIKILTNLFVHLFHELTSAKWIT